MTATPSRDSLPFLNGDGELSALMRAHDWSATSLGLPQTWPQALRTVVRLMLNTGHPMYIFWGPDHACLYNDAYRQSIGPERHPASLGRPAREVWDEIWPIIGPQIDQVLAGRGATWHENALVPITRNGRLEEVYWTYSYSPIDDYTAPGGIGGVLVTCTETTQAVLSERNRAAAQRAQGENHERLQMALDSGAVVGTWVWDVVTDRVTGDDRFARAFSLTADEARDGFPARDSFLNIHPDDRADLRRAIEAAMAGTAPYRAEYRLRQPDSDGTNGLPAWRWVEATGTIVRDETGAPVRFPGVLIDIDSRKRAQQDLLEAHKQLRMAHSAAGVIGTWFWDLATGRLTGDEGFARVFGVDPQALHDGLTFEAIVPAIHPDDFPGMSAAVQKAALTGETCIIDYRVRRWTVDADPSPHPHPAPDNAWRWITAMGKAELDTEGRAITQAGIVLDIDDRKRVEQTFSETQYQLAMAQTFGGIGVFSVPVGCDILTVSEGFCAIFGIPVTPTASLSALARNVVAEDGPARSTPDDRAAGTTPAETEYRIRRVSDGAMRWIYRRAEFLRDADGKPTHMVGMVQDITERKLAVLQLKESQAYLNLMVESVLDYAIIALDATGRIVLWNTGARNIFGHAPEEVQGQPVDIVFTDQDRAAGIPRSELSLTARETRRTAELWLARHNGQSFFASAAMAAMHDAEGEIRGFIYIVRDMTADYEAQEAIVQARNAAEAANIAKTEFLANMSHEIRTPMNAIIGLSTILSMSQPLTPKQETFIKTLRTSADSLLLLINDLLDITKIEARTVELERVPFSVPRLLDDVAGMLEPQVREKDLRFDIHGAAAIEDQVWGDATRLRQIIVNLCSNAVKFTQTGGITITCHGQPSDTPGRRVVCITVADTGIGIAPDKLDSIFDKFVQADTSINRQFGGTGLGLAISRTLAELMGGTLTVSSELGRGSVFTLRLPLEPVHSPQTPPFDSPAHLPPAVDLSPGRGHILLVEDHPPNVLVAQTFLEGFGYRVDIATNGREAVERRRATAYTAILMDVQMHEMNGYDATRRIRELEAAEGRGRTPIIGMTAHALSGDRERCLDAGMDDYITKPFRPSLLEQKLQDLTHGVVAL